MSKDILLLDPITGQASCRSDLAAIVDQSTIVGTGQSPTPFTVNTATMATQLAGKGLTVVDGKLTAAAAAASSVSATVPAGAVEGDIWHTTLSTTAPYAKASTYAFIGGQWLFISGYASAEASVAVNVSGIGTPVSQAVDTGTLVINTLNASSTVNTITIPADGVYETHMQLNPGTTCTSASNVAQFGYGLRIFANGSEVFSNFTPLNALNTSGYSGGSWGSAMQCSNTAFFYAGTTIRFEIYASNCTIVGGVNARVSFRSRGGL